MAVTKKESSKSKTVNKKASITVNNTASRKRKSPKYSSFKLSKKIPHPAGSLPGGLRIFKKSIKLLIINKKPLLGILFVYTLVNLVLVHGFTSPLNIADLKQSISGSFDGSMSGLPLVSAIFGSLLGSSSTTGSETSAIYQSILFIVISLAIIWVFRQSAAGNKPTAKAALYGGMYPLVPFLLVLMALMLQLTPALLGVFVYGIVISGGIAATFAEQFIWAILLGLFILLSVYMICSSIFALYVVTLPNMNPMKALRSSRNLVFSRRLSLFRKLLLLPLLAFLLMILIVVPAIYFVPIIAPWLYFVLTLASLIFLHSYLFTIYKELL